jgi:hypothetical protein
MMNNFLKVLTCNETRLFGFCFVVVVVLVLVLVLVGESFAILFNFTMHGSRCLYN